MKIVHVNSQNFNQYRHVMLAFVKRLSPDVMNYKWLYQLKRYHLNQRGTKIILALWDGKIIAIYAISEFGTKQSIFLLSPQYQHPYIGTKLLKLMKNELGVSYVKLNISDKELIKMALNAGYVSFHYVTKQDKSIFLWFGGGKWNNNDIPEKETAIE